MTATQQHRSISLVGQDLAAPRPKLRRRTRGAAGLLMGMLLAGLFLTVLRVDILRLSYALGEALQTQQSLESEFRSLTAEVRTLRDPARLSELASQRGFQRPARIIETAPIDSPGRP